jgi:hypothetical protein
MIIKTSSKNCWAKLAKVALGHVVWIDNDAPNHPNEAKWYAAVWIKDGGKTVLKVLTAYRFGVAGKRGQRPHIIKAMPDALQRKCV